jgi:hypothetical protein
MSAISDLRTYDNIYEERYMGLPRKTLKIILLAHP